MTGRRPIGPVDTIWLNMDRPNNLMVIDAIMWFEDPVDWDRLQAVLSERLVQRFPVFSQRPLPASLPLAHPQWEDDPDFDIERHLIRTRLPEPGDDAALQAYVESQVHVPMDRDHPLWQYHLIDGYSGGAAVLCRFHHALADGAALTEVLLSTTDPTPDTPSPDTPPEDRRRVVHDASHEEPGGLLGAAVRLTEGATAAATHAAIGAMRLVGDLPHLATPGHVVDALTLAARTGQVANKLLLHGAPPAPFDAEPGVAKRVCWSASRDLQAIKKAARPAGATVNDVVVAALAGALSRYLAERGADVVDVATLVPVNVRPTGEPLSRELGNQFALVLLELPTAPRAPLERLAETKHRMDVIKNSPEVTLTFGLINAIGRTGPEVERHLVNFFSNKSIGVTTNVIGARETRYVAGTALVGMVGWVPGSGHQSIGTSILTYAGTLRVGFKVDATIVPDPHRLVTAFDAALDEYLDLGRPARRPRRRPATAR